MKIVVIGGSGLIGSKLVNRLREKGHEVVAASPASGVNTMTGEGLAEVMVGASVVVDVANSPSFEDRAALDFLKPPAATFSLPRRKPASGTISRFPSSAPRGFSRADTSAPKWPRRR
jgi:NAD(P)-dependent dehydrogenase (short-subunit alcohol dehydrogenase family)